MSLATPLPSSSLSASAAPGWLRRALTPLVEPETFDFWAGQINRTWTWARPLARVVERHVEALDTVTLVLQPNRHVGGFLPGQHVNISAPVKGRRLTRSYSLTGIPHANRRLSITVKRVDGGALSTHLTEHVRVGDVLEVGPAFGEMTLPAQPEGRWLFLAAGSGITPLMGLTRALAARRMPVDLTLLYWAKTRAELCFLQELRALAERAPRFHLQVIVTHEASLLPGEATGFIDIAQLQQLVPHLDAQQVFACGPGGFVEAAREATQGHVARFMAEGFTPAAPLALPSDAEARTVRVQLRRSGRELDISTGMTLLDALEAQGLNPPSGCRMGVCHTCSCPRLSGTTHDLHSGEIASETERAVRLCVSRACSDLTLDL